SGEIVKVGGGSRAELQTIFAVVDTLALNIPEIARTGILVDGEPRETLAGHISLGHPFAPDFGFVEESARGKAPAPGPGPGPGGEPGTAPEAGGDGSAGATGEGAPSGGVAGVGTSGGEKGDGGLVSAFSIRESAGLRRFARWL